MRRQRATSEAFLPPSPPPDDERRGRPVKPAFPRPESERMNAGHGGGANVDGRARRTGAAWWSVDEDLVEAARRGDREAYVDLIRMRSDHLYALANRIL